MEQMQNVKNVVLRFVGIIQFQFNEQMSKDASHIPFFPLTKEKKRKNLQYPPAYTRLTIRKLERVSLLNTFLHV